MEPMECEFENSMPQLVLPLLDLQQRELLAEPLQVQDINNAINSVRTGKFWGSDVFSP